MQIIHQLSVKIPSEEHGKLKTIASIKNRTPHYLIREAIHQYIEREEENAELWKEAMESWADYQKTGLHLTGDEVFSWMDACIEKNAVVEMPPCHT